MTGIGSPVLAILLGNFAGTFAGRKVNDSAVSCVI
jgi:hypothetical protein